MPDTKQTEPEAKAETKAKATPAVKPESEAKPETETKPEAAKPETGAKVKQKQPMNPSKKKKIIIISVICSVVAILGIVAAILIPQLLAVNYGESYRVAKDTKTVLSEYYNNDSDCYYAVYYMDSKYTSESTYDGYVKDCLAAMKNNPSSAVEALSKTSAVQRDEEIKQQFNKFNEEFQKSLGTSGGSSIEQNLNAYKAWHSFIIASSEINRSSTDAKIAEAATALVNSGNDELKSYANEWIAKKIAYIRAYRDWFDTPGYYNDKYDAYKQASEDYDTFEEEKQPEVIKNASLGTSSSSVYSEFSTLFDLIADKYEEHYNFGSNDCLELLGNVYCNL